MNFSLGPWRWEGFERIVSAQGHPVLWMGNTLGDPRTWGEALGTGDLESDYESAVRSEADARLIAAAPEMYALLKDGNRNQKWCDLIMALLARIDGEATP